MRKRYQYRVIVTVDRVDVQTGSPEEVEHWAFGVEDESPHNTFKDENEAMDFAEGLAAYGEKILDPESGEEWEMVRVKKSREAEYLQRMKVPGGWLVLHSDALARHDSAYYTEHRESMVFLPDPEYKWVVES
ncbi:MAG TPA: hypothetical protein PK395_17000 [bacterium]|nr:hypothetical protein [bacterium]HQQ00764.1 hypothetical protein [bacterium]